MSILVHFWINNYHNLMFWCKSNDFCHAYICALAPKAPLVSTPMPIDVVSGVPQGSVLGPLLCIVYIDDVITKVSPSSTILLFADDIALYCSIQSPADYTVLQADITAISLHIESNKHLKFHADTCSHMLVAIPQTNQLHHSTFTI